MKGNYAIKNKSEFRSIIKDTNKTQKNLAEKVGIGQDYISQIMNGKATTKVTAYAISKAISSVAEIEDFFEKV